MGLYKLHKMFNNGCVYLEIQRDMYVIPQSGILDKNQLKYKMVQEGYSEVSHTPGL